MGDIMVTKVRNTNKIGYGMDVDEPEISNSG